MKRILSIIFILISACATFSSCVEQMQEVTETLLLGRCLSPTEATAPVDRTDGRTVAFTWAESKGALQYTIEIFEGEEDADPATVFAGTPVYTEVVEGSPLKKQLPSDKFYFARVKAQAPETGVEDSKWVEFPYPIGTYEVKSNLWPEVVTRTSDAVTVKWTEIDADRVDHIRVSPNPDDESKSYKRYDVAASDGETVQTVIDGLAPSVKYTFAVHYKSANRGEVQAWTRPSLDNPTVVSTSEELNNALKDGASVIKILYSETPYLLNELGKDAGGNPENPKVLIGISDSKSIEIYGDATEDGKMPVVTGMLTFPHGLVDIRVESIKFDGINTYNRPIALYGKPETDETPVDYGSVEIVNCEVTGYLSGVFYYDSGTVNIGNVLLNNLYVTDIAGSGGDCIDIRPEVNVGTLEISESTYYNGVRDFLRIDKAVMSSIKVTDNTLCNICNKAANKGIFYVRATYDSFEFSDNLIMHASNAEKSILASNNVPTSVSNNWFYKLSPTFWMPETDANDNKINASGKGKLTQTAGLAGGGQILSSDPCYDSAEGNLYVKNAAVLEAKVGDPRWLQEYKPVVEDLTLAPVAAGKSWNLTDTKTFGKTVKTSVVRDGLRFIVGANPFKVSEKGLEFAAAGSVEALGVPSDAAIAFMVDTPGTVILSTQKSNTGSAQGHLTVAYGPADGSRAVTAGSANVNEQKVKIALPNIVAGEPQIVYLYGCTSLILSALQWSDQIDSGASPVLGTPQVTISQESVDESFTGEVKLTWDAVSAAGSYKIYVNVPADAEELPAAYAEVTETEWNIPFKTLGFGKFTIQVQACPASDDMSREPSELSEPKTFEYCEVLKPVLVEKVWGGDDFKWMCENTAENNKDNFTPSWTSYVHNNLEYYANGTIRFKDSESVWYFQYPGSSLNSGAVSRRYLKFIAGGPGTLSVTIDATATGRNLHVLVNDVEVGFGNEAPVEQPTEFTWDVNVENESPVIIYADGSLRVYSIKWTPSQVAATQEYTMTLSATAGVLSTNITGIPSSWRDTDATWTAKDDSGKDEITFTGNVYYSSDAGKNIVWYFNKSKTETHVTAAGLGKVKKVIVYPNSDRKPEFLKCSYGDQTLAATEPVGTNSSTITFDFAAAGIASDTFRIDFNETGTNVEVGRVEIIYEK